MDSQSLFLFFIVSAALNMGLAIYGWRYRRLPGAAAFSIAMLFFSVLPLMEAIGQLNGDLPLQVIALKSRVEAAGIGATAWLVMMLQLTGFSHVVNRRLLVSLSIVPFIVLILNWTENPLFRWGYFLDSTQRLQWNTGPFFWFGLIYLNIVLLAPLFFLWRSFQHASPLSFKQTFALSLSVILPILLNVLIQTKIISIAAINFPFAAGPLMGLIVVWAVFRFHLFDVVPFARSLLIESMSEGVLVIDTDNRIVDINPAMQRLIGPVSIGQDAERVFAGLLDLVARLREIPEAQTEIVSPEHPSETYDLRITPLHGPSRHLTGRLIVVRNITELKHTEKALRKSENNFRRMLEFAPDAILIANEKGEITYVNEQCERLFGYAKEELTGQPTETLIPESLRVIHRNHRAEYYRDPKVRPMAEGSRWKLSAQRKDGSQFPVEISLSPLETETGLSVTAAIRDISARQQIQTQIRLQAAALEAAANAIMITDRAGVIEWVNPAFVRLTGYTAEESIGRPSNLLRSYRQSDAFYKSLWDTIQSGMVWEDEIINRRKDGIEYVEHQTITPVTDEKGEITHYVSIKQDITARHQMEDELAEERDLLQALMDNVLDTIYFKDVASRFVRINRAQTKVLGVKSVQDAIGKTDFDFQPQELAKVFFEEEQQIIETSQPLIDRVEYIPTQDGKPRWFSATKVPLKNQDGIVTGIVGISRDVTERKRTEDALRDAEARYRTLIEQMPAVVYTDALDEAGTNTYISPQVESLLGYPLSDWQQDPYFWEKCVHPDDFELAMSVIHRTLNQGRVIEEYRMVDRDGKFIWVRDHSILIRKANEPFFVQGFLEDVTERKQAEAELQRQKNYLEALHQITLDLFHRRDASEVLQGILERATEFLNVPFCAIMLIEGDDLVVQAFTRSQYSLAGDRVKRTDASLSWQAFDTHQVVVVNDYSHWPLRRTAYDGLNLSAVAAVPIMAAETCIGVLDISRSEPDHIFDTSEIEAATLFAQLVALVLDNTQLYSDAQHEIEERKRTEETLRRQNDYLTALHEVTLGLINRLNPDAVMEGVLVHVAHLMKTQHALVDIVDPIENVLIQKVSVGNYVAQNGFRVVPDEGLNGKVWASGKALVIPDYSQWEDRLSDYNWVRSVAGIPMKVQGNVIGVIGVAFDEPNRSFTPEEIELLERFANLASMALDNAQLMTAAVRQSQELRLLHDVRSAIAGEIDLKQIVYRTVEAIAETFGYTLVSLYLLEGDALALQHQVGYDHVIPHIPITEGIAGRVIRTGLPVFLEDVHSDPAFLGALEGIVSEIGIPILNDGQAVGILNIESRFGVKLTQADLRLMMALGEQISIAIGRSRAYGALRRNNERLSVLHEITLDLLNQRKLDELSQTITDYIKRLLNSDVGFIALKEGDELVDRAISPPDLPYQMMRRNAANDPSQVWQVFETKKAFVTNNMSALSNVRLPTAQLGLNAAIFLPVQYGESCQGVLGTARFEPNKPFDPEDISFGNLFANLVSVALDNAQLHETLRQESIHDPLTSLFNRRYMEEALHQAIHKAERSSQTLAIVMLDLDHFKNLNDTFGHDAGDEALRRLGLLLKTYVRASDIACRYGGEEFTLILPEASLEDSVERMQQLRQDVKQLTIRHEGRTITQLSGSFGIAMYPQHGKSGRELLQMADGALYRAKQAGRDRVITA